ncbi:aldo/keto reductase [Salmonella enterica subsp. enterica serovar Enteritidis str. SA19940857]|nr:aldo/keto reductase [Salmonella enterica subsp. enterica serovar Enteritidis str. SA19940857]
MATTPGNNYAAQPAILLSLLPSLSTLGLGTMTFGEQNSEADAHAQLDYAIANGINLIDAAEMYPVPPRPETQGLTESYIGNWLAKRGNREKLIIASKVSGPARNNDR